MEYITTTNLRTQSPQLVKTLQNGGTVSLIHRSKVVGVIKPVSDAGSGPIDVKEFSTFLDSIKPKKVIPRNQREKIYRKHLVEKYGKRVF